MSVCAEAQDCLDSVEASIGDLIPLSPSERSKTQMSKSWDFGPTLMTEGAMKQLESEGCFPKGKGRLPRGETIPHPEVDEAVVYKDFFACGLQIPLCTSFAWFWKRSTCSFIILRLMAF